jgi:hypothetical protein
MNLTPLKCQIMQWLARVIGVQDARIKLIIIIMKNGIGRMAVKLINKPKQMKSILFKPEMIQAILDRRKTQTRRVIKPQPDNRIENPALIGKPKYQPGDIVYVKETWRPTLCSMPTGWPYDYKATAAQDGVPVEGPWKSPLFMPERAARIFLEITDVRVERYGPDSWESNPWVWVYSFKQVKHT